MFSISKLNLEFKRNSTINLIDYCFSENFALLCIYQSSSSSDTGNLIFIQQSLEDGSLKVKKLIWITDSKISAFSINPTCDWIVIAYRSGMLCILPIGTLMGRIQKKSEHWKPNDVTYLHDKLKPGTFITCMKWWISYKKKNMCIIGRSDGDLLIIDLENGMTLIEETFPDYIHSIDLLITKDKTLSYCFITTKIQSQWKLLLEEIHERKDITDSDMGFDFMDFSNYHSHNIINSKTWNKSKKKKQRNPSYLPSKLYQFPQSTFLKSQYVNGKCFLGAYDQISGKYKLFECDNLDSPIYEFQLPLSVIDICVTEDLLYLIIEQVKRRSESNSRNAIFTELRCLKLCIICRQFAHSRIIDFSPISNKSTDTPLLKYRTAPKGLSRSIFIEFDLPGLYSKEDILSVINFPVFFNFSSLEKIVPENMFTMTSTQLRGNLPNNFRKLSTVNSLTKEQIYSKWTVDDIKSITPIFIISSFDISVCYMSQCFEDKFIDYLLSYNLSKAEWLGVGLKLDMNELYRYTAQLLASGIAHLNNKVTKSRKVLILEYFELASASLKTVLSCISQFWPIEKCLIYFLSQLTQINKMSPANRVFLSNAIIPMFGHVMSDPLDSCDGIEKKINKYHEKFRRFIVGNFYFNDLKAAKTMFQFGLLDEAFYIAKEKGCVLELFSFIIENNYNTNWFNCFTETNTCKKYLGIDRDVVLNNMGLVELEIVARSEPKFIKALAEFICDLFMKRSDSKNLFSFHTTMHLCSVFNPYGSIIDTLFRIFASENSVEFPSLRKDSEMSLKSLPQRTSSTESLTDMTVFSETIKIKREIGPLLLTFCLLVISKDNQIDEIQDYLYFIQMYTIIHSVNENQETNLSLISNELDKSENRFDSIINLITWKKAIKQQRNVLSRFWSNFMTPKLLFLRDELCISISVMDVDLFDENEQSILINEKYNKKSETVKRNSSFSLIESKPSQRCQIKLLGFIKEKSNRILLLPKSIESGKEIIRQICLGKNHALILTESGSLYSAGTNECGQLGIENHVLKQNSFVNKNQCLSIIHPMLINMELNSDECIFSIAAGDYHSGAIVVSTSQKTQSGHVFTWGWGVHGQLGHGDIDDQFVPKRLIFDFNNACTGQEFPIELSMGCFHSVILTNKGSVYCFGNNTYGQLGVQTLQKSIIPNLVDRLPPNIIHVDTKYFHTVCCTASNEIFTWGIHPNIWQNSLNHDKSHEDISTPESIYTGDLLSNKRITQISCGTCHTSILTDKKLVYCFGSNVWGQLGLGNRKDNKNLVEVNIPVLIDFVSSDDGITIAMSKSEISTKLFVWGRCGHSLIQEHIKNPTSDTLKPQLLIEYQHVIDNHLIWKNCFGIDTVVNGIPKIISKKQLMIIFLNFSKYIDRTKFLTVFERLKEYDIISDYYLMNELLIQSLFWRIQSIISRLSMKNKDRLKSIENDIEIAFKFYLKLSNYEKYQNLKNSILSMITGFFKQHNLPWNIYEQIIRPLIPTHSFLIATQFTKFSLDVLSSEILRDLFLNVTSETIHEVVSNDNIKRIELTLKDIDHFYELIRTGNTETIYDAANDHKVVFFSGCGHAFVIGRYREHQLRQFVDKLRKKQLNLSVQMIQRLYNDSSIFPDCLDCLSQKFKF